MSEHTPEPWVIDEFLEREGFYKIRGKSENLCPVHVYSFSEHGADPESTANAARIVACVNACAGIKPEAVPDLVAAARAVRERIIRDCDDGGLCPFCGADADEPCDPTCEYKALYAALAKADVR